MTRVFLSHAHMYVSSEGKIQEIQAANPTEKEGQIDRTNIGKQTPSLEHTYCSPAKVSLSRDQIF